MSGLRFTLPALATLWGIFSVAYSVRFIHQVFFGPPAKDLPRPPHEPTRGMLGNVLIVKKGAPDNSSDDQWLYSMDAKDQKFMEEFFAQDPDFQVREPFFEKVDGGQGLHGGHITRTAHDDVWFRSPV